MLFEGENQVVLYLEGWQMRMVKDFQGTACDRLVVPITGGGGMKYMGPPPAAAGRTAAAQSEVKKMYLTEWQKREIAAETGEPCEFIELQKGAITRYGAPTPQ
ncbi:MAG: hypothetical protein ABSG86_23990 [Thermoguttaceae bacterium]|jgi:hypothetical protein